MKKIKNTSAKAPSLGNLGLRVSPYGKTGLYMELHKLDYKKTNLEMRFNKNIEENKSIERQIALLKKDMNEMMVMLQGQQSSASTEEMKKTQSLKY